MEALNITKSDLKFLLVMSSIVPVLSFISGFYIANGQPVPGVHSAYHATPLTQIEDDNVSTAGLATEKNEKPLTMTDDNISSAKATTIGKIKLAPITKRYIVQAGLFSDIKNAKKLSNSLLQKELDIQIIDENDNGIPVFRVIIGSFDSRESAQVLLQDIEQRHSIELYLTAINSTTSSNFVAAL
jgi:cell division septation protein DedD